MNSFWLNAAAILGVITAFIISILKLNKDKFKFKIDESTVKRKEVSDILEKWNAERKQELIDAKKEHAEEIKLLKIEHAEEIKKRDLIINELIARLPIESREVVQQKMKELNLNL